MRRTTVYEFDTLTASSPSGSGASESSPVPPRVFAWLEAQALSMSERENGAWLRLSQRQGQRVVQVTSFVGVIRAPDGYQIEVLPKIAKAPRSTDENIRKQLDANARKQLIEMLCALEGFRHVQIQNARLLAARMPLLEVFIGEFLRTVEYLVKRGLRSEYKPHQDNLFYLRGRLEVAKHVRQNPCHRHRFSTTFEEFSSDRAENRLLHTALKRVLGWTSTQAHQQLARELCFAFSDVPVSHSIALDFRKTRLDRSMDHYRSALEWARLILGDQSPLTGAGDYDAVSLLFPMEAVFEAFVARHLARQLVDGSSLQTQVRSLSLVKHLEKDWFRLKPDLLVRSSKNTRLVLDTKWKLIDSQQATGSAKYGLDQNDFYQIHAYGQNYLDGVGDVVLIYPSTPAFNKALPVFSFSGSRGLRLWVLPFCLDQKRLLLPRCGSLNGFLT